LIVTKLFLYIERTGNGYICIYVSKNRPSNVFYVKTNCKQLFGVMGWFFSDKQNENANRIFSYPEQGACCVIPSTIIYSLLNPSVCTLIAPFVLCCSS